jgi:DeoR/GlpR family transcriptional regulator of sugar metabolism
MEKSKLNSQERIFEIIQLLHENHVSGLTNKELAALVRTSEANICRDMALFDHREWVIRGVGGRWRLSPAFGGIAGRIMRSYQEAKLRLTEEEAQYASAMQ